MTAKKATDVIVVRYFSDDMPEIKAFIKRAIVELVNSGDEHVSDFLGELLLKFMGRD